MSDSILRNRPKKLAREISIVGKSLKFKSDVSQPPPLTPTYTTTGVFDEDTNIITVTMTSSPASITAGQTVEYNVLNNGLTADDFIIEESDPLTGVFTLDQNGTDSKSFKLKPNAVAAQFMLV